MGGAVGLGCGGPQVRSARRSWIGWTPSLRLRCLPLIANNVRFLLLPEWRRPNWASRILALNVKRLSRDWERYDGHPILLAETFVDAARFRGTCYLAAGWQVLGTTRGFAKRGRGYGAHGQPKLALVCPLHPQARQHLTASFLPPSNFPRKEMMRIIDVNCLPLDGEGGLVDLLRTQVDPRKQGIGRNPQTGAPIKIPAKTVVKFRLAKSFKDAVVPPTKR